MVFMGAYVVVTIMQDNGWVIVEDVVDVVVLVELSIGGLASNSSRIEKCFVSIWIRFQEVYVGFSTI